MDNLTQNTHLRPNTTYVEHTFNGCFPVRVPSWSRLPKRDIYEPKRTGSMAANLKKGDVLFDIGIADGWISAIYAQMVGAENLCMFEPTPYVWANVKALWEENHLNTPRSTFCGFVSDKTVLNPPRPDHDLGQRDGWPIPAYSDVLLEEMQFRSVTSRPHDTPQTTIDSFVERTGIIPRAFSVDVEGAETLVLKGARKTLSQYHPLLWLSVHTVNGAIFYDYGSSEDELRHVLRDCGYDDGEYLETWGDAHWLFRQKVETNEG